LADSADRLARIEELRRRKQRSDRRKTLAIAGVLVLATAGAFAKPAYNWVDKKLNDPLKRSIASFGVPLASARCDAITSDPAGPAQQHVAVGTRVDYTTVPPSSGKHYSNPVLFAADPFFTSKDNPPVENVVHNLEHGYTVLWYDPNLPSGVQHEIKGLAARLRNDAAYQQFIATPWDAAYGAFPEGKRVALSHWSAPDKVTGTDFGHRLLCAQLTGEGVRQFMDRFPATDAPERALR